MEVLIGMDEAGYGPNLGPLVVAATAWHVEDEVSRVRCQVSDHNDGEPASAGLRTTNGAATSTAIRSPKSSEAPDLYRRLRNIVAKSASERRVPIADSKVLYSPA